MMLWLYSFSILARETMIMAVSICCCVMPLNSDWNNSLMISCVWILSRLCDAA